MLETSIKKCVSTAGTSWDSKSFLYSKLSDINKEGLGSGIGY